MTKIRVGDETCRHAPLIREVLELLARPLTLKSCIVDTETSSGEYDGMISVGGEEQFHPLLLQLLVHIIDSARPSRQ